MSCTLSLVIKIFSLESMKKSGCVAKCNPTGEFSLESIKMYLVQSTSPVHQSSPVIVVYRLGHVPLECFCVLSSHLVIMHGSWHMFFFFFGGGGGGGGGISSQKEVRKTL